MSFGYSGFCVGRSSEVTACPELVEGDLSYSFALNGYKTVGRGP